MLVLSRRLEEWIVVDDNIGFVVVEISGDKVRLGIRAPVEIPVHRQEVYEAIKQTGSSPNALPEIAKLRLLNNSSTRFNPEMGSLLVLSRKRDESIRIGADVVLTVVDIRGDKVRLGIEAPGEIPVHRWEVYQAIKDQEERRANLKDR